MNLTTSQKLYVLKKADALLSEEKLWWKGKGVRVNPEHCLMTAVETACFHVKHMLGNSSEMSELIGFKTYSAATKWNDAKERTFPDVKARLAEYITKYEAELVSCPSS